MISGYGLVMDKLSRVLDYLIIMLFSCVLLSGVGWLDYTLGWHNHKYSPMTIARFLKHECSPLVGDLVVYLYPKNKGTLDAVR